MARLITQIVHVRTRVISIFLLKAILTYASGLNYGGWIELKELDLRLHQADLVLSDWRELIVESGKKSGMEFEVDSKLRGWLADTGFVNIKEFRINVPVGPHDQRRIELGIQNQLRLVEGVASYRRPMIETLCKSHRDVFLAEALTRRSLKETPDLSQDL